MTIFSHPYWPILKASQGAMALGLEIKALDNENARTSLI